MVTMTKRIKELTQTKSTSDLFYRLLALQHETRQPLLKFLPDDAEPEFLQALYDGLSTASEPYYLYHIHFPSDSGNLSQGYIGVTSDPVGRYKTHRKSTATIKIKLREGAIMTILERGSKEYIYNREHELRPQERMGWNKSSGGLASGGVKGRKLTYKSLDIKENCYRRFKGKHTLYRASQKYTFNYISHFAKEMNLTASEVSKVLRGELLHTKGFTLTNTPLKGYTPITTDFTLKVLITPQGTTYKNIKASEVIAQDSSLTLYALKQLQNGVVKSHKGYRTQESSQLHYYTSITLKNVKTQEVITRKTPKDFMEFQLQPRDISSLISGVQHTSKGFALVSYEKGTKE